MGVQIGRSTGTGFVGYIRLPGFLVTMMRKTLFLERLAGTVDGSVF